MRLRPEKKNQPHCFPLNVAKSFIEPSTLPPVPLGGDQIAEPLVTSFVPKSVIFAVAYAGSELG